MHATLRFLIRFVLSTFIMGALLLILISGGRALVVLHTTGMVKQKADVPPNRLQLAAQWSDAYPILQALLERVAPETALARRPPASPWENLLRPSDALINRILPLTRDLWPDGLEANVALPTTPPPALPPPMATDPDAAWATVSRADVPVFDGTGRRLRTVHPGSVVDVQEFRTTASGNVVVGTVHTEAGRIDGVIFRQQDLTLYHGQRLEDASREERTYASDLARLNGAIEARRKELTEAQEAANPHQQSYRNLLRRYQTLQEEGQNLKSELEQNEGAARTQAATRLREIQQEERDLIPLVREEQTKRDAWQQEQANQHPDPEQDRRLRTLQEQLRTLEASRP